MSTEAVKSKPTYWSGVTLTKHVYPSASTLVLQKPLEHGMLGIQVADGDLKELLKFIKDNFTDEWDSFINDL